MRSTQSKAYTPCHAKLQLSVCLTVSEWKQRVVQCWRGYLSGASEAQTCIRPSWCHCHSLSLDSVKSRSVLPFWYRLTRAVPEEGPLNGCVYEWKQQSLVWADNTGNDSLKTHGSSLWPLYLHSWLGAVGFHWSKIINSPHALGWRTFMMTCLRWILGYMRLEIWCKIGLSADWCLCTALHTRSGACYCWIECPCQQQLGMGNWQQKHSQQLPTLFPYC